MTLRDATIEDLEALWTLNQSAVPAVGDVSAARFRELATLACSLRVATGDEGLSGFLLALAPDAPYDSVNFLWFRERYDSFVYIDRIVVAKSARRRGLGQLLYDDLAAYARARAPILACEVNTRPRNEDSLSFHARAGFEIVGSQETEGGAKTVVMMVKRLPLG